MLSVSPTNAPWLSSCLKRYHTLAVLHKFPSVKQPPPLLRFGNVMHLCLKMLFDTTVPGQLPHHKNLDTILRLAFLQGGYQNEEDKAFDMARARKLLCTYLSQCDLMDSEATVAVERAGTFPVKVGGEVMYEITARLDRILRFPHKVVGIDYKLGTRLPPTEGILVNLCALKAAYPDAGNYEFWVESLHDEGVERTVFKGEELRGAIHTLTAQVRRYLSAKEYPAEPNEGCVWCPIKAECQGKEPALDVEDLDF